MEQANRKRDVRLKATITLPVLPLAVRHSVINDLDVARAERSIESW
jgi:hypothetical protein